MSTWPKLILNTLTLAGAILLNFLSNTQAISSRSIGDVSDKYDTLFTPAGYAFSIWSFIYLMLVLFVVYQWYNLLKLKKEDLIRKTGWWFTVSNITNGLWVIFWVHELIGISVILMLMLLFALVKLVQKLDLEMWEAPFAIIFFVWWPVTFYLGWIILATIANISAFLVSIGWEGGFLPPNIWAIMMVIAGMVTYLLLIFTRNMREAALVGVWGLIAIAYRRWETHPEIAITAVTAAGILFICIIYHGYKNRKSSVLSK